MVDDGEFNNLTVNNVLTIGADTNLYRTYYDLLKTDDAFLIAGNLYGMSLMLPNGSIAFGNNGDTNLYRSEANVLKTDDHLKVMQNFYAGGNYKVRINTSGELWFGDGSSSWDKKIYRRASGTLATDGNFIVDGSLGVGTSAPQTKLHVKGGWLKVGDDNEAANGIQLETQNGFHRIAFKKLHFYEWGYGDMMILDNDQLQLPAQGSSGGIVFGGNVNLYHAYPTVALATDADFIVGGGNLDINASSPGSPISRITFKTYDDEEERTTYLEATCAGAKDPTKPILKTHYGLGVGGDINAWGFLGSDTDPNSPTGTGGGAILMGHALTDTEDMPCISMTSLGYQSLWIKKYDGIPEHTLLTQQPWGDVELGNLLTVHGNPVPGQPTQEHHPTLVFKDKNGNLKVTLTFDGVNSILSTEAGDLVFAGNSTHVRPLSNNMYLLGDSSFKWKEIWAVEQHFGDAVFANGWRLTEDPEDGVLLVRPDGSIAQKWR